MCKTPSHGKAAQEMVAIKESGIDCNAQPTLEGSGAGDPRRIVRDVSTSLDMTERAEGARDTVVGSFPALFVIPSEVEESLTISGEPTR